VADLTLPGLVDIHTHLRVPGGEHKEDFASGTAAALAGGITTVLAMPNTTPPLSSPEVIEETRESAAEKILCDVGLFAGASPELIGQLKACASTTVALKIYLNDTFGPLRVEELSTLESCFETWPEDKPIAIHAEGQSVAVGIGLAATFGRPVHFCHISRGEEVELIARAKERGLPVTCEVTPHHLFLTTADVTHLGTRGDMRPRLAGPEDVASLWAHIGETIDCIATDHAPHTLSEKAGTNPPPGVPGLETSLPLMVTAMLEGRLSERRLVELMSINPRRIFNLPPLLDTCVEVDFHPVNRISDQDLFTKCRWSPFTGMEVRGKVSRVTLRDEVVFDEGQILAKPGTGLLLPGSNLN
jgi:carbamoyl-phosphate synthase/aspartate carbamoyltransferase/dihydroorotase